MNKEYKKKKNIYVLHQNSRSSLAILEHFSVFSSTESCMQFSEP